MNSFESDTVIEWLIFKSRGFFAVNRGVMCIHFAHFLLPSCLILRISQSLICLQGKFSHSKILSKRNINSTTNGVCLHSSQFDEFFLHFQNNSTFHFEKELFEEVFKMNKQFGFLKSEVVKTFTLLLIGVWRSVQHDPHFILCLSDFSSIFQRRNSIIRLGPIRKWHR